MLGGLLLVTLVLVGVVWVYLSRFRGLPPGPWGLPVVGYLPWLAGHQPHVKLTALADQYGPIYSLRMGSVFTVVLSDPRLIRQAFALEDYAGRAPLFLTHGIMKGNGIICVQGEKWKEARRFVSTSLRALGMVKFGPARVKMEADITKGVRTVVAKIKDLDEPQDPEPALLHALGNVLFRLVFGQEWEEENQTWKILQHLQEEGTKLIGVSAAVNFLPLLRFLPNSQKNMKFIEEGIGFTHEIYQSILSDYEESLDNEDLNSERPRHLMGVFVTEMRRRGEGGNFNRIQFNYLMADIFGAGVDTTLATLRWFLLFMALYPEWQERIHEELDSVTDGGPLILDHLHRTPILEASLWETQRIRPVTPVGIPHGTIKETSLQGYRIPEGSMVIPLQWAVHMDPKAYHQPQTFDPARFIADDGTLKKSDHFLPFQAGKRTCVGEEYARVLLFLFGGTLLKEFRLSLPESSVVCLDGEPGITLSPPKHHLLFRSRTHP